MQVKAPVPVLSSFAVRKRAQVRAEIVAQAAAARNALTEQFLSPFGDNLINAYRLAAAAATTTAAAAMAPTSPAGGIGVGGGGVHDPVVAPRAEQELDEGDVDRDEI